MEWLPLVLYTLLAIAAALAIGRSTRECATKEEDDGTTLGDD